MTPTTNGGPCEPFTMRLNLRDVPLDMHLRLVMALVEGALDRIIEADTLRIETELIAQGVPAQVAAERLADCVAEAQRRRGEALARLRADVSLNLAVGRYNSG